jgi:SAM-dependent methyltransferase
MTSAEGAATFNRPGDSYDAFMGRFSGPLAPLFADAAGVSQGQRALDVGCGPGALTRVLVGRLGSEAVAACDPSPTFVAACTDRHPGIEVQQARAEALPFDENRFDVALAQLVLHFVTDTPAAAAELRRVVRPGGRVAACVWEPDGGMELLALFWAAAKAVDPAVEDETASLRLGREGELTGLFEGGGLLDVEERRLVVSSTYHTFDELWASYLEGVGPCGAYCLSLADDERDAVRSALFERLGRPSRPFALQGAARCAVGRVPA